MVEHCDGPKTDGDTPAAMRLGLQHKAACGAHALSGTEWGRATPGLDQLQTTDQITLMGNARVNKVSPGQMPVARASNEAN